VVLEGPAEFQILSDNEGALRSGRLNAHVPDPAHGFKVAVSGYAVVDHGTKFGCMAPKDGPAEVHVFAGSVGITPSGTRTNEHSLRENQAVRLENGRTENIPFTPQAFLSEEELARRDLASASKRLAVWRQSRPVLRDHPAALVYFDFEREPGWERTVANLARNAPVSSTASMIGCDWAEGRWPGKGGIEFNGSNKRLRLTVPGTYASLTFLAWIRVDRLLHREHSLAMTESFEAGEVHWYIRRGGELGLRVNNNTGAEPSWKYFHSPPVVDPKALGAWVFVASILDGTDGIIRHYCNGQLAGSKKVGACPPLRLNTFEIGNWAVRADDPDWAWLKMPKASRFIPSFSGRMDEFAILSAPLAEEEILRIYEAGRRSDPVTSVAAASVPSSQL